MKKLLTYINMYESYEAMLDYSCFLMQRYKETGTLAKTFSECPDSYYESSFNS
jgi:hypothetical protein